VFSILEWATAFNEEEGHHFPLVATSYGYVAVVKALSRSRGSIHDVPESLIDASLEVNLN
jgi:hypothetical protein